MHKPSLELYCQNQEELLDFLEKFYNKKIEKTIENFSFSNPLEMIDIATAVIDNNHKYDIHAWVNLDEDIFIKITSTNLNDIIKYLYERYP